MSIEDRFKEKFKCSKCNHTGARTQKLSMTGTGLSKLFDIQMHKYLFVSCENCGYTEVFDLKILEGKSGIDAMDILDLFFGG
ncbi:hypothetical protein H0A61_02740 [Koleobacter methoxysyntrophicus]|uniref:Uncharacterized protein n=1 Tax=Koleobacter methoxysyntrophicus TaxID=2751313 RepID=A0A8A0RPM1_9FIRM|nr:zinc ribbon domain-containing protein [Koleobacter methoxysyntrophicus]NPV42812.1 hypothetical protein [Bacillota bacterium]QSQ10335.1 hypothetical protein H0A61_02740 [Koleobacter methoxysyntrophicus]